MGTLLSDNLQKMIIQPPNDDSILSDLGIEDNFQTNACCRAIYVTPLCFSGKKPTWIVYWPNRGRQAYCDDCIPIIHEIKQLMKFKLKIEALVAE